MRLESIDAEGFAKAYAERVNVASRAACERGSIVLGFMPFGWLFKSIIVMRDGFDTIACDYFMGSGRVGLVVRARPAFVDFTSAMNFSMMPFLATSLTFLIRLQIPVANFIFVGMAGSALAAVSFAVTKKRHSTDLYFLQAQQSHDN